VIEQAERHPHEQAHADANGHVVQRIGEDDALKNGH
jgi:hypothetical protein